MNARKTTKKALLMSALSLLLCFSMLIGTTFAWFTDEVKSANNIIKSGNLDVELEYKRDWNDDWATVGGTTEIFNKDALYEPGYTEVVFLRVSNAGSLALKYNLMINIGTEIGSVNVDGNPFKLSDYLQIGYYVQDEYSGGFNYADILMPYMFGNREAAVSNVQGGMTKLSEANRIIKSNNPILPGEKTAQVIAIVLTMPTTVGNEANRAAGAPVPSIEMGVNLMATQLVHENDSFNNEYDNDAPYNVKTTAELKEKLANAVEGDEIYLAPGEYIVDSALSIPSGVAIYGAQRGNAGVNWAKNPNANITLIKYTGASTEGVFQVVQTEEDPADAISDITIDGVMIDCNGIAQNGILIKKTDGEAIEGIKIANCAVVNSPNNGMKIKNTYGAIIENNYVANVADCGIAFTNYNGYHYETWAPATGYVINNVIENVTACVNGAIWIQNGMGDLVVSGNLISNVTAKGYPYGGDKGAAITFYDIYEGGIITVENNMISNVDRGILVYKYSYSNTYSESWWEGPTTDNDKLIIKNNAITGYTAYGIRVEQLHAKSSSLGVAYVEIMDNVMSATVATKGLDIVGGSLAGWKVVSDGNTFNGAADAENGTKEG